jgi:hypothetical protein
MHEILPRQNEEDLQHFQTDAQISIHFTGVKVYDNNAGKPRNNLHRAIFYSKYLLCFVMAACHTLPAMRPACFSARLYISGCLSAFGLSDT